MNQIIKLKKIALISKFALAFVFIYQGLVPKILWLDETETLIVRLHHLNLESEMISLLGGLFEILLAVLLIFHKKTLIPVHLALFLFVFLFIDVVFVSPQLLIKAFNPLVMNFMGIMLCFIYIIAFDYNDNKS